MVACIERRSSNARSSGAGAACQHCAQLGQAAFFPRAHCPTDSQHMVPQGMLAVQQSSASESCSHTKATGCQSQPSRRRQAQTSDRSTRVVVHGATDACACQLDLPARPAMFCFLCPTPRLPSCRLTAAIQHPQPATACDHFPPTLRLLAPCSALSGAGALQQAGGGRPLQLEEPPEGTQRGGESPYLTELVVYQRGPSCPGLTSSAWAAQAGGAHGS